LYMFGSERGVSGASFGGRGLGSPFLVYPSSPGIRVFLGRPCGKFSWLLGIAFLGFYVSAPRMFIMLRA
jgi:hypothetical protein